MSSIAKKIAGFALVGLALGGLYYVMKPATPPTGQPGQTAGKGAGGGRGGFGSDAPTPVLAEAARTTDQPILLEGVGTARPLNTVTVKPQVEGRLVSIRFTEGQQVKKGDVLAVIDDTTYRAARDQAAARRALTETQLANAKRDLERYSKVGPGVVAQKTVDTQIAQVAQLEAQVKADAAAVASAEAVLAFTEVRAPIDGRTGLRIVDEGNVVRASDQAGIVVITQIEPISVQFTLPQQQLPQVAAAMARGPVPVDALTSGGAAVVDRGQLTVFDNQIDQTTGTVRMKAEFPNAQRQLWPGQFVNVRLVVDTLRNVVTIPTPAIQRGPSGPYVFVVGDDNRVVQTDVTIGAQTETRTVVTAGLSAGTRVVTTGFGRLQDGGRVIVGGGGRPGGSGAGAPGNGGQPKGPEAGANAAPSAAGAQAGEGKRGDGEGRRRRDGGGEGRPAADAAPQGSVRALSTTIPAQTGATTGTTTGTTR